MSNETSEQRRARFDMRGLLQRTRGGENHITPLDRTPEAADAVERQHLRYLALDAVAIGAESEDRLERMASIGHFAANVEREVQLGRCRLR